MGMWAIIRIGKYRFRVRGREKTGEDRVVVESVDGDVDAFHLRILNSKANVNYPELRMRYIPHYDLEIARILARDLEGEILEIPDLSKGSDPPGAVY